MVRRKKKTGGIIAFAVIASLIIAVVLFGIPLFKKNVAEKAADTLVTSVSEQVSGVTGIPSEQLEQVIDEIPEEDQKTVAQIVENHLNVQTIQDVTKLARQGDGNGLIAYARNALNDTEKEEVSRLADQYADIAKTVISSLTQSQKEQIGQLIKQYAGISEQ